MYANLHVEESERDVSCGNHSQLMSGGWSAVRFYTLAASCQSFTAPAGAWLAINDILFNFLNRRFFADSSPL